METTELCEIAMKYKTDKCPQIRHSYTPFYYKLFKDRRNDIKKLFEIGVGYSVVMGNYPGYFRGASLRMWEDFFPNAMIYGIDTVQESCFDDCKRIKTWIADQSKEPDLKRAIEITGSDLDIVIDDGSHLSRDQVFSCQTLMPLLDEKVTYIIEDVLDAKIINALGDYDCQLHEFERISPIYDDNRLVIVKHRES